MIVDLDAEPSVPEGYVLAEHRKGGVLDLSKDPVSLFTAVIGPRILEELATLPLLNANVLEFYFRDPFNELFIPNEWIHRQPVLFCGTLYRSVKGGQDSLWVRGISWDDGQFLEDPYPQWVTEMHPIEVFLRGPVTTVLRGSCPP